MKLGVTDLWIKNLFFWNKKNMRFVVLTAVLDHVVNKVMTSCRTMLLLRRLATRI